MSASGTATRSRGSGKAAGASSAPKPKPEVKERLINPRAAYDWSRISNELDDMGLSMPAYRVYCNLLRRSDKHSHTCYPGTRRIAHDCRANRKTILEALQELEERGMLKVERGWGKRSDYEILPKTSWTLVPKTDQSEIGTGPDEVPESGTSFTPVRNRYRNPIHSSLNPIQETTTTMPLEGGQMKGAPPAAAHPTEVVVVSSGAGCFKADEKRRDERLEALKTEFKLTRKHAAEVRRIAVDPDKGVTYLEAWAEYVHKHAKDNAPAYFLKVLEEDFQFTVSPKRKARTRPKPDPRPEELPPAPMTLEQQQAAEAARRALLESLRNPSESPEAQAQTSAAEARYERLKRRWDEASVEERNRWIAQGDPIIHKYFRADGPLPMRSLWSAIIPDAEAEQPSQEAAA